MLECVVNISESDDIAPIAAAGGSHVIDVHSDRHHNRSVLTMAGPDLCDAVVAVARAAIARLDLSTHVGVHPRIGVVDVVPWVDLDDPWADATVRSIAARDAFAARAADELGVPSYLYGPGRSLPEVRDAVRRGVAPDVGTRHPTAGAMAVGARGVLVAYNLWLAEATLATAKRIAAAIRGPALRALGLEVGDAVQVSCNLTHPAGFGPAAAYDLVASMAPIDRAELVGLLPDAVLVAIPQARWFQLDLSAERTIESRTR
ncbi:MAG: hypothetical protein ACYDH6_20915 [Acidimicrobiales bacterium]